MAPKAPINDENKTADAPLEKKEKLYRVIGKTPGASNNKSFIVCFVNGTRYDIKENEPVALNKSVLSYLENARVITHLETGSDEELAVDIEKGFQINVKKKFEIMEA